MKKALSIVAALALIGWVGAANATLIGFDLEYSGSTATGSGSVIFDDAILPIPSPLVMQSGASLGIQDFNITITGATAGNGTFGLADFPQFVWSVAAGLDLTTELVGQPQFNDFNMCGDDLWVCMSGTASTAPRGISFYIIGTSGGSGDQLTLTSFRPSQVPVPATLSLFGFGLAGLGWSCRLTPASRQSARKRYFPIAWNM